MLMLKGAILWCRGSQTEAHNGNFGGTQSVTEHLLDGAVCFVDKTVLGKGQNRG